jgi:NADPH:quinone reductase-like Zn-dependent oxidoreductase
MEPRQLQTAILQSPQHTLKYGLVVEDDELPVVVSHTVPKPAISSGYHVVVRVLAVALNPIDYKMLAHFPAAGNMAGCDFCGIVVERGTNAVHDVGTRVCGATFPYSWSATQVQPQDDVHHQQKQTQQSGAFAEFLTADSRLLLRVPDTWSDSGGAALGQVGWGTASLALSDPEALGLTGLPSAPAGEGEPVLVYGAATATGTMACQLLAL